MLPYRYIVVEGNIGAGKTSLAKMLAAHFNTELLLEEFAENTFLPQFYKDPERFAFPLEMSFMADRYQQLKKVFDNIKKNNRPVISDYLFDKSLLFARVNLKPDEFILFENFFNLAKSSIPQPDLLIYLQKEVQYLKLNIKKRGREFEKEIKDSYLNDINAAYDNFIISSSSTKKLTINSSGIDFVNNPGDFESILKKIIVV